MKQSLTDLVVAQRLTAEQGSALLQLSHEMAQSQQRRAQRRYPGLAAVVALFAFLAIFFGLRPSHHS